MKCNICRKHSVEHKDYRFIDSSELQGKVLVGGWCFDLNDDAVCQVIRDEIDPKEFYELETNKD